MYKLNRKDYGTQEAYLFHLYNDLGCEDISIAYYDGEFWSKWFKYDDLMHKDRDEIIWKGLTVVEFYEKANNRSVLDIEIMYDFDEDDNGSQDPSKIKAYAKKSISMLNKANIFGEAYTSGSKSIHYSVLVPELRFYSKHQRTLFKERALAPLKINQEVLFKADLAKKSVRTMIAMEGQKHWKTGNIKREVNLNE